MSDQNNQQSAEKMSPVSILVKVFTDPQEAFENVRIYPSWIFPILITLVYGFVFTYTTQDIQAKMQRDFIMESEQIPEASKDAALENIENPSDFTKTYMPAITTVIMTFVIPLLIAVVLLMFGNFVFGGSAKYLLVFSATAWAGMIGLLEGIIKLPLMLNKGTLEVYTSLALVMDLDDSKTFMFQLLNIFDIFAIWKVFVYAVAFSVIYKFSAAKSYTTIITLYLILAFIGIGFAQLFM